MTMLDSGVSILLTLLKVMTDVISKKKKNRVAIVKQTTFLLGKASMCFCKVSRINKCIVNAAHMPIVLPYTI